MHIVEAETLTFLNRLKLHMNIYIYTYIYIFYFKAILDILDTILTDLVLLF